MGRVTIILITLATIFGGSGHAQISKRFRCPRIIGIVASGELLRKRDKAFECYRSLPDAIANGFRFPVKPNPVPTPTVSGAGSNTNGSSSSGGSGSGSTGGNNSSFQTDFQISGSGQGSSPAFSIESDTQLRLKFRYQGTSYYVLELRNAITNALKYRLVSSYGPLNSELYIATPGIWIVSVKSLGSENWNIEGSFYQP